MLHFDPDAVPVTSPACQSGFSHYCTGTRNPLKVLHTHTHTGWPGMMKCSHLHTWLCLYTFNSGKGPLVKSQNSLPPLLVTHRGCWCRDVNGWTFVFLTTSLVGMCKKRDMLWFGGTDIFGLDSVMPKSG